MSLPINCREDLWEYLSRAEKPILLYGMGNGADKILSVCRERGIEIADTFASDGFVRGHLYNGRVVLSYSEAKRRYGSFIVLLSFASSLPDVLGTIHSIAAEQELYAPDVPVFGNTLFDRVFFEKHTDELTWVYENLQDSVSKETFLNVVQYKLTGKIDLLDAAESDETDTLCRLFGAESIRSYADLGAYNGDTVRKLIPLAPALCHVIALEPDRRNYRKLCEFSESVKDTVTVESHKVGAWSKKDTLFFDASGNRNANLTSEAGKKVVEVEANTLDNILDSRAIDFIKYDVEGAEREALLGSLQTITQHMPRLLVSLYHRSEDIFTLPRLVRELGPSYRLYLRKHRYIPAWDLNLYAIKEG